MDETVVSRLRARGMIVIWAGAVLAGCGGGGGGNNSTPPPAQTTPPPTTTPPVTQSQFQQIQDTIFTPMCTGCHVGAGAPQGLRLDAGNSYALLVNVASTEVPTLLRVKPGDPQNSYLVQKIEGRQAVGGRMPLGRDPLPQASIDLIRAWIAGGAPMSTSAPGGSFTVSSTIPAAGEVSTAAVKEVQIIFNADVDASLASSVGVSIQASGGDGRFDDGNERTIPVAATRVSSVNPRVLMVYPAMPLVGDNYRLVIQESAGISLADYSARVLDGNADGTAGGEFTLEFRGASVAVK